MSRIEELLRKTLHGYADRLDPTPEPWEQLQERTNRVRVPRFHLVVVVCIAVLAVGSVVGVRLLGDREKVTVVAPAASSPSIDTRAPIPSISPSAEPSGTPTASSVAQPPSSDGGVWTSPDGVWTVRYPDGWFLFSAGSGPGTATAHADHWGLTNFRPGTDEGRHYVDGDLGISLSVSDNTENWTLDSLLNFYCEGAGDPDVKILNCRNVQYNGDTWAYALARVDVPSGTTSFLAGIVFEGRLYQAFGGVPDGTRSDSGRRAIADIFATFTIE